MRVPENWDRPCGPVGSYYQPLRFTDLIESETNLCVKHQQDVLRCSNATYPEEPANNGLGNHVRGPAHPALAETSVAACGGSSRSSAFGTCGFWNTSAAAGGHTHSRVAVTSDAGRTGLPEQTSVENTRWASSGFGAQASECKIGLQSRSNDAATNLASVRGLPEQTSAENTRLASCGFGAQASECTIGLQSRSEDAATNFASVRGLPEQTSAENTRWESCRFGVQASECKIGLQSRSDDGATNCANARVRHTAFVENDEVKTTGTQRGLQSYSVCHSATNGCHPSRHLGARDDDSLLSHKITGKTNDHRDDSTFCNSGAPTRGSIQQGAEAFSPTTAGAPVPAQTCDSTEVEVRGSGILSQPWHTWEQVAFPSKVRSPLISAGFQAPTLIQQYAWPILLNGRDVVGVAKTGSGKTLAFLLPAMAVLLESKADMRGPPAILVLAPTRELACQIEQEAKQFGAIAGMRAACLYGGAPKGPQLAELRQRPQVLVATPGRLNDLLDPPPGLSVAVDVKAVRYLVLDEADRMLDMGFEPQIRKIINMLPQERQTVMFTATWPTAVRRLASDFLRDFVEVRVGEAENLRVNPDIEQRVVLCDDMYGKEQQLVALLQENSNDQTIVFVNTKRECETVALRVDNSVVIHGDKDQHERDMALSLFKSGSRRVLVATDVAARGLDIKDVRLVILFDPPNREEDYVHRVGRTGRAGKKGTAVTFLTNNDGSAAQNIVDIFRRMNLSVPAELERRLASGEMRPRRPNSNRRGFNSMDSFGDKDPTRSRFSTGHGLASNFNNFDFGGSCFTDCPT